MGIEVHKTTAKQLARMRELRSAIAHEQASDRIESWNDEWEKLREQVVPEIGDLVDTLARAGLLVVTVIDESGTFLQDEWRAIRASVTKSDASWQEAGEDTRFTLHCPKVDMGSPRVAAGEKPK